MKNYTYVDFANEVIAIASLETELTPEISARVIEKATALLNSQTKRAEYSATHKKPTASKVSDVSKARAEAIRSALTCEPATASELCAIIGEDLTALQVANVIKLIDGVKISKVVRTTIGKSGLRAEKLYTAYAI